ncbi:uncharacterized protein [Nerophis lumbriciformis]|uniref:uncharacterized protein isoform X1 n=1 Tax=Nerophis lumbriciformis TaxID=546530 RepID=UPI002ADF700B|nr:uncharacterized protein LOC133615216 isoform X1 [Nerophis lumbriciformis]XP_061829604.1 uncharacterized protein LOC133615216 isoform X1 [Nerophis lumbriciformis]
MAYQQVLLYVICTLTAVSAQDVKYFLKGQDIHLAPSISQRPIGILWLHNRNDVVLFIRTEDVVYPPYKNRVALDWLSAELTIKNATYEDSGVYDLDVNINNKLHTFQYRIEVIDQVSKPNISCERSDTQQATLVCSTESKQPHLLMFKWYSRGKEYTGPNLTVWNEDDGQVYRCDVSNPLTNETASFTNDCFLDKRSNSSVITAIHTTLIVVIIVCCCVLYIKRHHLKDLLKNIQHRRQGAVKEWNNELDSEETMTRLMAYHHQDTVQLEDISNNQQVCPDAAVKGDPIDTSISCRLQTHRKCSSWAGTTTPYFWDTPNPPTEGTIGVKQE